MHGGRHVLAQVSNIGPESTESFLPELFDRSVSSLPDKARPDIDGHLVTRRPTLLQVECFHPEYTVRRAYVDGAPTSHLALSIRVEKEMSVSPGEDATPHRTRPHILVVEDNPDTGILMEQILEDVGETTVTADPQKALSYASETAFDLIMLDINLGSGMDGTDVLRELRSNPPYSHTPILALTAYALPGDREKFLKMGFTAYMSKPFEVEDLLELSGRLLQESVEPVGSTLAR